MSASAQSSVLSCTHHASNTFFLTHLSFMVSPAVWFGFIRKIRHKNKTRSIIRKKLEIILAMPFMQMHTSHHACTCAACHSFHTCNFFSFSISIYPTRTRNEISQKLFPTQVSKKIKETNPTAKIGYIQYKSKSYIRYRSRI